MPELLPDLDPVAVGSEHVKAHNDERDAINALLEDHIGSADVDASVETAVETYAPGSTAAYAKVTSNLTTTSAAYPGTSLAGLTITVVGNGRPVEIELVLPGVAHSVANAVATFEVTYNAASLGANNMLAAVTLPATATKSQPLVMKREITIANGVSATFVVNAYGSTAGTLTLTGAAYAPMELKAIRR